MIIDIELTILILMSFSIAAIMLSGINVVFIILQRRAYSNAGLNGEGFAVTNLALSSHIALTVLSFNLFIFSVLLSTGTIPNYDPWSYFWIRRYGLQLCSIVSSGAIIISGLYNLYTRTNLIVHLEKRSIKHD